MWKRLFIKVVIVLVMFAALSVAQQIVQPQLSNEAAMTQLQDTPWSFTVNATTQAIFNWLWVVPAGITVLMFIPEIKFLVAKAKGNITE